MKQLTFVYNADSGLFSSLNDFAHKIISPSTYSCNLCALTYGNFTMKTEWKDFIQQLPVITTFLHKDEFEKQYQINVALPAVFIKDDLVTNQLISREEIDNCVSLKQLKNLISSKLTLI